MDIQFNKINPSLGVVSITLRQSDYGPAVEKQLKHYAQTVRLKGFRLGAVPVDLIKKMHGSSILAEELYKMAAASLKDYIVQERIPIFMEPLFMMPDQPIDLKHQDTFTFSYEIGIIQERSLVLDPNISVKEFEISDVDPKLVDEFLQGLQIVHGETVHLDESEPSAMLYGTLVDGTGEVGLDIRIAIMHVAEHLRDSLIGLNVGAQVTITEEVLKSHFPALLGVSFSQFTAFKKHASAWPATFTIDKIVRVLPAAIDATLFDLVLGQGVVSSENDFREAIAKIILFDKRTEARYAFHEALKKVLLEHNVVDLPEDFLKRWLTVNNPKATSKEVEDYYNTHEEDLKWEILLGTIVRQNNLAVTPSDIVDETKRAYVDYVHNNGLQVEMNDSTLHACALSFLQGEEGNQYYANLHNRLSRERAIDFIKKQISIVAEALTAQEFDVRK